MSRAGRPAYCLLPTAYCLLTVGVLLSLVLGAAPVAADDTRTVGRYRITASYASTPVYGKEPNGLMRRVVSESGEPVTGLESALRLRISVPNQVSETWELTAVAGEPGLYRVDLLLPRAGTFTMDLFGTLDGQQVFERFITGENGLEKVITRGRQYPRGSWVAVLITFGIYPIGLAFIFGRRLVKWRQARRQRAAAASRT